MNALRNLLMLLGILATLFLLVGCGGGGGGGGAETPSTGLPPQPGQALQVVAMTPEGGSEDADLDTRIDVSFSGDLDDTAFPNPPLIVRVDGIVIPGTIDHDAARRQLTFTPTQPLPFRAEVEVTAQAGIRDTDGNTMTEDVAVGFMTRLPMLGSTEDVLATPDYERALAFKLLENGKGVMVFADDRYGQNANLIARLFDLEAGTSFDTTLGSGSNLNVGLRGVDIAPNGDVVVAWRVRSSSQWDAFARIYDASVGTWTNTNGIEFSTAYDTRGVIAGINNGGAMIAFPRAPVGSADANYLGLKSWEDGSWKISASVHAGTGIVSDPVLAMGAGDTGVLAWSEEAMDIRRVRAITWLAGTGISPTQLIDGVAPTAAAPHAAAVASDGSLVVVYAEQTAPTDRTLWAVRYDSGSGWHGAERLDIAASGLSRASAVAGGDDAITVAWLTYDGQESSLAVRRLDPITGWDDAERAEVPFLDFTWGTELDAALDGTVMVAATTRGLAGAMDVHAMTYDPQAAAWSGATTLFADRYALARRLLVTAWQDGYGYAAWTAGLENAGPEERHLRGRWAGPDGVAAPLDRIDEDPNDNLYLMGVGIDAFGRGLVLWEDRLSLTESDVRMQPIR